jgi:hypothetical protein
VRPEDNPGRRGTDPGRDPPTAAVIGNTQIEPISFMIFGLEHQMAAF